MPLRNAVHRRNHKERSQLAHRSKFGLLEKHKDYVQRAKDHNVKKQRIQKLAQKASLRNPDEFNFGMIRGASNDLTKGGMHIQRRETEAMDNDLVAILKSQDLSYIQTAIRSDEKQLEAIRQSILPQLGFMSNDWLQRKDGREETLVSQGLLPSKRATSNEQIGLGGAKKTVWVDDVKQARAYKGDGTGSGKAKAAEYSLDSEEDSDGEGVSDRSAEKRLGFLVSQLDARQKRLDTLRDARSKLEVVRALMTTKGTSARKVAAKADALTTAVVRGKVTANGLSVAANDDDEDNSLEENKKKRTTWKWGRERKR